MINKVYIDSPKGRVELKEAVVDITVPGLSRDYTFVHLTDVHFMCAVEDDTPEAKELAAAREWFWAIQTGVFGDGIDSKETRILPPESCELVKERILQIAPDAVLFTGDTVDYPSRSNFRRAKAYLDSLGCPCIIVPGNHDTVSEDADVGTKEAFAELMGGVKPFFSERIGEVQIIGFDDFVENKVTISDGACDFLEEALKEEAPARFLLLHAPVFSESAKVKVWPMWGYNWMLGEESQPEPCRRFRDIVTRERDRITALLAGHVHTTAGDEDCPCLEGEFTQYISAPAMGCNLRVLRLHGQN